MKNKKIKTLILVVLILALLLGFIVAYMLEDKQNNSVVEVVTESTDLDVEYTTTELSGEWSDYTGKITLSDEQVKIDGNGITSNGNIITINSAGTYYITGTISDGNIVVNAGKNDDVTLVLDNASITSKTTAPINGIATNKLTITLAQNSVNKISDASEYTVFTDTEDGEPDGAIFTKTDLVINGEGKLIVTANYKDGIVSKDGLKIINSEIDVTSADDGIRGKDYVALKDANITINSKGDGIKSTNSTDEGLGYIAIEGGKVEIKAEADGIQAETILKISKDSNINITTSGAISSSSSNNQGFGFGRNFQTTTSTEDSSSSKGLKAGTEITIDSGNITISSTDDSIHSNGTIIINNGTLKLSSGDDGIHADTTVVINDGDINITKSYEGIESAYIEINGGTIDLVASDDGVNVCGGNDLSSINGRQGQNGFSNIADSSKKLVINGGKVEVNADGDGLDANGSIYISGGTVEVAGANNGGNGPLDYDGECAVTGGELIIYGATGMWQNPSNTSTQYSLSFQLSGNNGDEIVLKDSSGTEIATFETQKAYGAITISSEKIKKGETYTLYQNGSKGATLTADSIVSTSGNLGGSGTMQRGEMNQGGGKNRQSNGATQELGPNSRIQKNNNDGNL